MWVASNRLFFSLSLLGLLTAFSCISAEAWVEPTHRVTLPQAHEGTLEMDTRLLDSYGRPPEAKRNFYLQAREILAERPDAPITDDEMIGAARTNGLSLISGPILGDLAENSVSIWLRPLEPRGLTVRAVDPAGTEHLFPTPAGEPGSDTRIRLNGLKTDTPYQYQVVCPSGEVLVQGSFRTAPKPENKDPLRIAFGADFHKIGLHNPNLFRQILERDPLVMLLYGDLAADGRKGNFNMHRADYLLRDVSPAWSGFAARMPVYASWDDWDYFANDTSGVMGKMKESDRQGLRAMWHEQWINPDSDPQKEGIYFSTRLGPVEIFMLDTRSCRVNDQRGQYGCYLGLEQQEWLKEGLRNSTAPFKIVSSGTMWSDYVSKAKDSWGTWDVEGREEIFNLIEKEKISGVLLLSGDRHGARAFTIPRESGFKFYEFNMGCLGGVRGPKGLVPDCPEQLFGYDGKGFVAFGEFTFAMDAEDPTVTFRLIHESGEIKEEVQLSLSQLTP
jgi:alkaline phosphatase D